MESRRPGSKELPVEHLTTSDRQGRRVYVYPAAVRGRFRNRRAAVHAALIFIFLALPWLRINGRPVMLLDVATWRFTVLGITFWAHDAPRLVFLFGGAALALGLAMVVMWRRNWCVVSSWPASPDKYNKL